MLARAMVLESFGAPLTLKEIEIPPLRDGEVLVKILASGVCGSDLHISKGEDPRTKLPMILGHEGVGKVIESCGEHRDLYGIELNPGDHVVWDRGITCGKCWYCVVAQQPALCPARRTYGISIPSSEPPFLNGCYASHVILRQNVHIIKIEKTIDPFSLVAATCSGATVACAFSQCEVKTGDTVVIQGPGPLGVFSVDFAAARGAKNIVVIGGTKSRLDFCKEMGATHVLDRKETNEEYRRDFIFDLTNGRGADVAVEVAGVIDSVKEGLGLVRKGGAYLSAGISVPEGSVGVDWFDITRRNIKIQCSWVSASPHLVAAVSRVCARPEIYSRLVTHRFPIEKANEALECLARREAVKIALTPE